MDDAYELWRQAGGGTAHYDSAEYRRLLIERGLVNALKPGEKAEPLPCGWPTGTITRDQLAAMNPATPTEEETP